MATCERVLHQHAECVKDFIRDARTHGGVYAPGSFGDDDRCKDTRQAYVDCRHGPKEKVEKKRFLVVTTQAQPLDFEKQRSVMGRMSKQSEAETQRLPTLLTSKGKGPPACEMELSMHGKCVENYFRSAITKGEDYIWLSHDGEDKCFKTRAKFEKCLVGNKAIAEGRARDPTSVEPLESRHMAKHWSVAGHW